MLEMIIGGVTAFLGVIIGSAITHSAKEKWPTSELSNSDYPVIGPECFANRERTFICYKGEYYYKACDEFVYDRPDGGQSFCVKRIGHPGVHEAYDGTINVKDKS